MFVCVGASICVCGCLHLCVLKLVSRDKILRFKNTLISISEWQLWFERVWWIIEYEPMICVHNMIYNTLMVKHFSKILGILHNVVITKMGTW